MSRWIGLPLGLAAALAVSAPGRTAGGQESRRIEIHTNGGAYLGVQLDDVGKPDVARLKLAEERGALVKSVEPGTPAEKAGLKEGDVILRYQGEVVQGAVQLGRLVRETPPGRTVSLEVSRGGAVQKLSATVEGGKDGRFRLGELDVPLPPLATSLPDFHWEDAPFVKGRALLLPRLEHGPRRLGIEYQEISGQLARFFKLSDERGLLVTSVDADGPAGKAGLRAGDVILKFAGKDVRGPEDLRQEVAKAAGQEVPITVQREGKPIDLKVKVGEPRHEGGEST
jgi:serine protease Do